ncbi:Satratoxin biosynthesis SC1 cluster protein 4 [Apiospora arundinis]
MDNLQPSELQNQRLIIAVVTTCTTLAAASLALRFYAPRHCESPRYWFGDYWMAGVLLLCLGMGASEYIGVQYGYGTHAGHLDPGMVMDFKKNLYASMLLWTLATFSVKIGILLSYWRLNPPPNHTMFQNSILVFAVCSLCFFLVNSIGFAAQCIPISTFWAATAPEPGQCLNKTSFYFASNSLNSVLNIGLLVLPLPVVWSWQTSRRRIAASALLFMLGIFALVASIVRIAVVSFIDWNDATYTFVSYNIWGVIEVLMGFTCANVLSAAPLVARWLHMDGDGSSARDFRSFKKAYLKRHNSNGTTKETMSRILATPSPGPTLMSLTGMTAASTCDDNVRWSNTPTPIFSSYGSSMSMQQKYEKQEHQRDHQREHQKQQQKQQHQPYASDEAGEENDSIHELLHQGALMGSLRSATPTTSSRCVTPSSTLPGSRCITPTTPATPSTPDGPMHLSQQHYRQQHQVSRISSRSSVRSSFGDIQVRRVVVMRVEGVEPGHRGQSFETHVTSCDDGSSCHSSERGMNMEESPPSS